MPASETSPEDFKKNFSAGKTQLVWQFHAGDLETPVSAYLKLCADNPYCFLLESVEGGAVLGRYSVIGMEPDLIWQHRNDDIAIWHDYGSWEIQNGPAIESLRSTVNASHIDAVPADLPPMAVSGLFGYMGYEMIRLVEDIPANNPDDLEIPDSILTRPQILVIFDNVKNMICFVTPVYSHAKNTKDTAEDVFKAAQERLQTAIDRLSKSADEKLLNASSDLSVPLKISSNTTETEYKESVNKAVDYIHQGEIFQAVLGQRFSVDFDLPAFNLYRSLRALNPSPFMFHLSFENFALVGSSPEILVRVRGGDVTIRPIAGTRKRGATPEEDKFLAEDLLADTKERAEHLMLLDLGRNDVGRVAEFGSVKVTEQFNIEYYSHVMHIVSNVEGKLRKDVDIIDALFAGFPAGTVSGAPKIRAMEIIDELEKSRRSYYAGAAGYLSGNGEMDTCIALRTALVKDGKIYVQAGAGIVADSNPDSEYQETVNKAQAVIRAAEDAVAKARKQRRA
jgi:anthranilate synthase component I